MQATEAYLLLERSGQTKYKAILKMVKCDIHAKYLEALPAKRTRYDIALALMEIEDHKGKFEVDIPEPEPADMEFSSKLVSYGMQHEKLAMISGYPLKIYNPRRDQLSESKYYMY